MRIATIAAVSLALSACGGSLATIDDPDLDADNDGLTNAIEAELGTDPNMADTDGDGLSDGDEHLDAGTDPLVSDTDTDGLSDGEELDLGTDPLDEDSDDDGLLDGDEVSTHGTDPTKADTDGEGFGDGDEVDHGSDPTDWMSYPRGNGITQWPDNTGRVDGSVASPGWDLGKQVPDFTFTDQYGNDGNFYQFYGHVVLVDFSAGWCGPCRTVAAKAQSVYDKHADKGFLTFHMMIDDNAYGGGVTDPGFLSEWAGQYGLTFPVVSDPDDAAFAGVSRTSLYQGGIPFMVLLDQDLVVVQGETGSGSESRLEATAERLLGD